MRHLEHVAVSELLRWGWGLSLLGLLLHLLTPKDMFTSDPETSATSNYKIGNGNVAFLPPPPYLFYIEKAYEM